MLVFWGSIIYFFAPMTFFNGREVIFFTLLNLLLIVMIIGLVFLSVLILPYLEWLFLFFFTKILCRGDARLHEIAWKNLLAHEKRNTKTAIMLTLAFAFLIFSASSF
mmetsp:Transcript_45906/g.33661  ORF Transcript_45906/g.33661 Transcript_45906/m.33661 type:complete len:107 (-) Transcript_45906:18-338(-)